MSKILPQYFFTRSALQIAPDLIGKTLVVRTKEGIRRSVITEVEAYNGENDKANHASKGRTSKTEVMYHEGGYLYVYLVYGMYHMLNVVVDKNDYPAAILIRSTSEMQGPGRLTKQLGIDMSYHGKKLGKVNGVWIEEGIEMKTKRMPRIGVDYAGKWASKKWRWLAK